MIYLLDRGVAPVIQRLESNSQGATFGVAFLGGKYSDRASFGVGSQKVEPYFGVADVWRGRRLTIFNFFDRDL